MTAETIQITIASLSAPQAYARPPMANPTSVLAIPPSTVASSSRGRMRYHLPGLIFDLERNVAPGPESACSVGVLFSDIMWNQSSGGRVLRKDFRRFERSQRRQRTGHQIESLLSRQDADVKLS